MTITNQDREVTHVGNGSTTVWPHSFPIPNAAAANVVLIEVATGDETIILPADYTITGLGEASGTVTYPTVASGDPAITSAYELWVYRITPLVQEITVNNQNRYDATVVEAVWDRIVMMIQDLDATKADAEAFAALLDLIVLLSGLVATIGDYLGELDDYPVGPNTGDYFYHTTENTFYVWDGDSWEELTVSSIINNLITEILSNISGDLTVNDDGNLVAAGVGTINFGDNLAVVNDGGGIVTVTGASGSNPDDETPGPGVLTDPTQGSTPVTEGNDVANAITNTNNFNTMIVDGSAFRFPPGHFWFNGPGLAIDIPDDGVMILGSGQGVTFFHFNSTTEHGLINRGDDGAGDFKNPLVMDGMTVIGEGTLVAGKHVVHCQAPYQFQNMRIEGATNAALHLDNVTTSESAAQSQCINVEFFDSAYGVLIEETGASNVRHIDFKACRFSQNTTNGLKADGVLGLMVDGGVIGNNTGDGLVLDNADGCRVSASIRGNGTYDANIGSSGIVENSIIDIAFTDTQLPARINVGASTAAAASKTSVINAGADFTATTIFGSSVSSGGWEWAPPALSDFPTELTGTGITRTTDESTEQGPGVQITAGTNDYAALELMPAPASTPWALVARTTHTSLHGGSGHGGLVVRDSVSGKHIVFGQGNKTSWRVRATQWNNVDGGFGGWELSDVADDHIMWLKIENDGTTLTFKYSQDALFWVTLGTRTVASLTGPIDQVGFGAVINGGNPFSVVVTYFEHDDFPATNGYTLL